jgi:aspartate/methionine/tyrosine aminotransferase
VLVEGLPSLHPERRQVAGIDPGEVRLGYVQTNGTRRLRERIARLYPGAEPGQVVVTTGGAASNFLAVLELLDPGDRAVFLLPAYAQTHGLARWLGARIGSFELLEERGWQPAPGAAEEAITPETRLVVVTNPNNPTGSVLSESARREIVEAADRAGAWILADEVYRGAELDGPETETLWGDYERVVVSHSLSKAYGLPGLRLGWLVAPADRAESLWARKDYTTIAPSALSDALASAALHPDRRPRVLARTRRILRENMDRLGEWLDAHGDLFRYRRPDAGAICFVGYRPEFGSGELAERLRSEESVLLVPGEQFGREGHLRIGFGEPASDLSAALDRISRLVRGLEDG